MNRVLIFRGQQQDHREKSDGNIFCFINKRLALLSLTLCLTVFLSACGVKPGSLEAPNGEDADQFPSTYPAESTLYDEDGARASSEYPSTLNKRK